MKAIIRDIGGMLEIQLCAETENEQTFIDDRARGLIQQPFCSQPSNYYDHGGHMSHEDRSSGKIRTVLHYNPPVTLTLRQQVGRILSPEMLK